MILPRTFGAMLSGRDRGVLGRRRSRVAQAEPIRPAPPAGEGRRWMTDTRFEVGEDVPLVCSGCRLHSQDWPSPLAPGDDCPRRYDCGGRMERTAHVPTPAPAAPPEAAAALVDELRALSEP